MADRCGSTTEIPGVTASSIRSRARVGLGEPSPYGLRHSFASLLIPEQRVSLVDLAEQLGHAPTMTLNTYAHVMSEYRRSAPVDVEEWIMRARRAAGAFAS